MPDERRIVIGYESSESGRDALELGRLLSEVLGAPPIVVTAIAAVLPGVEPPRAPDSSGVTEALAGCAHEMRSVTARSVVSGLRKVVAEAGASVIVLGSSERGPQGRALLGRTGESLAHGAECAVAVAPKGFASRKEHRLHEIGAAFDGSTESWSALTTAINLTQRTHGSLTVLTADDYPLGHYSAPWSALAGSEFKRIAQERNGRLLELALGACPPSVPTEGLLLSGEAGPAISEAGEGLDLIVAGSRGQGLLRRTLLGSTTRHLMSGAAACPALILPRDVRMDPLGLRDVRPEITAADAVTPA